MIFAKKSLGQNFLKNGTIINEIIKVALSPAGQTNSPKHSVLGEDNEMILEIGPGQGVLTEALLATGATVVAVEKDDRLIDFLTEKFSDYISRGLFKLIHGDILSFWPREHGLKMGKYKIVANIPYYLTGQILRQFLESDCQPTSMVLMIQKEVAERILAKDGKESILSISVKCYGEPKYIRTVSRGNFQPAPKVDSAVLLIDNISPNFFSNISAHRFFEIVKKGFGQKRKMLKGNLGISKETLLNCGVSPKARAEELTLNQWGCLTKQIKIEK